MRVKLAEIAMCDCKKSKVIDWLGKSREKWGDLGNNLGKPPCKVVPEILIDNH